MLHNKRISLEVLESQSLDQIEYRIRPILLLLNFDRKTSRLAEALIDRFEALTRENVTILQTYA